MTVVPQVLLDFLRNGVPRATVHMRRGLKSNPGTFEQIVAEWCRRWWHLDYRWEIPLAEDGPGSVFQRDARLVAQADLVLAFFAPYHAMTGGTGHVVERAIDRDVPVYSFTLGNRLERVGDHDPHDLWGERINSWFSEEP